MTTNWYGVFPFFIGFLILGFFVFDNSISPFIFGISGATIGWILYTNKIPEKCQKYD
ncbi:hypothetical protein ACLIBG_06100 [Virgibacillus sp. W0181]|uniref:hypothetical protein n=1 Tax=Virgibacillus sp. W0181 TaxID=3391581 RepID=UPI003F48F8C5